MRVLQLAVAAVLVLMAPAAAAGQTAVELTQSIGGSTEDASEGGFFSRLKGAFSGR